MNELETERFFYINIKNHDIAEDTTFLIRIKDFNILASIAVSLENDPTYEASHYYESLVQYYQEQKNDPMYPIFETIISNEDSIELLMNIITLTLLEQKFRYNGIYPVDIAEYNYCASEYQRIIDLNNEEYENMDVMVKTK